MRTAVELITQAKRELESRPGYRYAPAELARVIEAGELPEGTEFMRRGDQRLIYYRDRVVCVVDGIEVRTMPVTDAVREAALIVYAKDRAERAVKGT